MLSNTVLWPLLLLVLLLWFFSAFKMRSQINNYRSKVQRLQYDADQSGQLSEQHLDMLMSAIDQVMLRMDNRGYVLTANKRALALFGIKAEELPQPIISFYRDSDWQERFNYVFNNLACGDSLYDMQVGGRVLMPRLARLGENDLMMLCLDITEKHQLEVQRRTFMANLMHDLKTPLTSLLGYARSLQRFGDDKAFRDEAIQVIADESKHVNHLLECMLTLDQIEFAGLDPQARCVADDVIYQVVDMLNVVVQEKQIHLQCDIEKSLPELCMDMDSLERVVRNLLENAMQYAPIGGEVSLSLQQEKGVAKLIISDNGPGIPKKHLKRVTERFYRVDKARSREYGGHGLGLAIVKELCEAHSGKVKLHNRDPHGLEAKLTIPLVSA
ncbi:MAG: ATP-binding protein [Mariprofundus sp.]|nr:ATP-binding protein [Mariprofundus sp.]